MIHDFTLAFGLPDSSADPASFVDALFEEGCDDAVAGLGKRGLIVLMFARSTETLDAARSSAIEAVQRAIPGVVLQPDD